MCFSLKCCCCGSEKRDKDFEHQIEKTPDGLTIKIKAKSQKKAEALKKLFDARKELCGEDCI